MTGMAKILIVEDDALIVKIYKTRLSADGYTVISAEDGEKGLATALAEKPDLILLDVMMPLLDGFSVLKSLRDAPELAHLPIIVYSNLAQEAEMAKAIELGATEFITKANISPTELVAKIRKYVPPPAAV